MSVHPASPDQHLNLLPLPLTELQGIDFKQRTAVFVDRNVEAAWVLNHASPNGASSEGDSSSAGASSSTSNSTSSSSGESSSRSRQEASKAVAFDLVVGADGGSSKLRSLMEVRAGNLDTWSQGAIS